MQVTMIGIDHKRASIAYRELFSFTKAAAMEAMKRIRDTFDISGCLLLSTCNRTELWISYEKELLISPYDMLCQIKGIDRSQYGEFFVERKGSEAVDHLLRLACGLNSKIVGEDQIISQVRESLALSRKCGCEDMVLEKLFQTAIAAAKKVKSTVRLTAADQSTAHDAVARLKSELGSLKGMDCLIIGNGQMGKLIAGALVMQGANVTMTLRKKIHSCSVVDSIVPEGCTMLPYEERHQLLASAQVVVSATLSPHFTLTKEDVRKALSECESSGAWKQTRHIWLDLAVPRDIDPDIAGLGNISIFDIDTLGLETVSATNQVRVEAALSILDKYANDIRRWFSFRRQVPAIHSILQLTAEDTGKRLCEPLSELGLPEQQEIALQQAIAAATEKSVGKLLFGLRDTLPEQMWESCLSAIGAAARKDTLKTGSKKDRYIAKHE